MEETDMEETDMEETDTVVDKIKQLIRLKEKKKRKEAELKDLDNEYDILEATVFGLMFDGDIQSIEVAGKTVFRRIDEYVSVSSSAKDEFFEWLRENGHGDLIKEQVNAKTLSSWYKTEVSENEELREDLKPMLNVFERKVVGIRKR